MESNHKTSHSAGEKMPDDSEQEITQSIVEKAIEFRDRLPSLNDGKIRFVPRSMHLIGFGRSGKIRVFFDPPLCLASIFSDENPWIELKPQYLPGDYAWENTTPKIPLTSTHLPLNTHAEIQPKAAAWGIMRKMKNDWIAHDGGAIIVDGWDATDPENAFKEALFLPAKDLQSTRSRFAEIVRETLDEDEIVQNLQPDPLTAHEILAEHQTKQKFETVLKHLHPALLRYPESLCVKRHRGLAVLFYIGSRKMDPLLIAPLSSDSTK